ncbi:MAG: LysR family transcriptional regulator [Ruminococcaceae bacterium]|nr:LysR family transcriptional regulator [Oscillospiraceae bacterium]
MNISYDYYAIFYYVAKYGSFTKAANALLLNQPNLTRTVKSLEEKLGRSLFVRSNKGVKLTPAGEILFEHVSAAFDHFNAAEEELSLNKSLERGVVSIGVSEIALNLYLLPILNLYKTTYPGVKIKISHLSAPGAIAKLGSGLIDLAMFTAPMEPTPEIVSKEITNFKETVICGEAYRDIITEKKLTFAEIVQYPIVSFGKKTSTYDFYFHLFGKYGLDFTPDVEAATADQIIPLVRHNLGIGFVPERFLSEKNMEGIYRVPLAEDIPIRQILLAKKRSHALSMPAKRLEQMILDTK